MKTVPQRRAFPAPIVIALALAAGSTMAGCASQPQVDTVPSPGAVASSDTDNKVALTGSRIPVRRSEKMLSQVGGKDYRETAAAQAAPLKTTN